MSQFVLHRTYLLRSTKGLSVNFVKGQPVFVPKPLWNEALELGAEMLDASAKAAYVEEAAALQATPAGEPSDAFDRSAAMNAAFAALASTNSPADYTASGLPKVGSMARVMGWEPDATERATAYAAWKIAQSEGAQ